jgi:hypothetical protein
MKYLISRNDALTFHNDFPFILLHHTYALFTYSPQFISLHFTSLRFIFGHFSPHLHFALFITS